MNGRLEKEIAEKDKINIKLKSLPPIITEFYNWMNARDKTYTTIHNYISHVVEFMNFITNGTQNNDFYLYVNEMQIESFMSHIKQKNINNNIIEVGDDIRAAKWSSLNTFFKFLVQRKYINTNPMEYTERPKIKTQHSVVYMNKDEIKSVMQRIEKESRPMDKSRDKCIITIGLATGLRVSAISNINIEDIDFKTYTIKVVEKGRKVRNINFSENLKSLILLWIEDRKTYFHIDPSSGPLFISQKKNRMSIDSIQSVVNKYTNHLNEHITPHKLRSTAAMNLYSSGVGILTIASVLGHENITTTQRYTTAFDREKENATSILDSLIHID